MLGTPVHWRPRLPWRLRCAGTTVRRVSGTLAPTIAVASTVRRDYGAPGLRCAGTTVRRDYGAPKPAVPPARGRGAPASSDSLEQRAAPTALVLGQVP